MVTGTGMGFSGGDDLAARTAKAIEELGKLIAAPADLLIPCGLLMREQVARNFEKQADPVTGSAWIPTGKLTLGTRPGGGAGGKTLYDTGQLLSSIVNSTPVVLSDSISQFTNLKYAAIHQYGGTILPKRAKMLSIPLTRDTRRSTGAGEWWARNERKSPFIIQGKEGGKDRLYIVTEKKGGAKKGELEFHWMLVRSSKIPQRRYLGWNEKYATEVKALIVEIIADTYKQMLKEKPGGSVA